MSDKLPIIGAERVFQLLGRELDQVSNPGFWKTFCAITDIAKKR